MVHAGSLRKLFILQRLKELGITLVCLHPQREVHAEPYVDHWIHADLKNTEVCKARVQEYIVQNPSLRLQGVITFWDECVVLTAFLAEHFGWKGIPSVVASRIKNKAAFRAWCREQGLPAPMSWQIVQEELTFLAPTLPYPVVVKPVHGASSAFVVKVNTPQELEHQITLIQEKIRGYELAPLWKSFDLVIEEYIEGQEVDMDILIQDGVVKYASVTDNEPTHEPYFIETGECAPSRLPRHQQQGLIAMAAQVVHALGIQNGCVHFEAKYTPHGPVPVEINLRMGGGGVYLYNLHVWDVDLVEKAAHIACGIAVRPRVHLASRQFLPQESGVLASITVDPELYQKSYVVELYFQKKVGDTFLAPPLGYDSCIGWLTVQGRSHEEAQRYLQEGMKYVTYTLEPLTQ